MSDINWDLAPEGAVELRVCVPLGYMRWFNVGGQTWSRSKWIEPIGDYETIATRPQPRKTVEDAVADHDGKWPSSHGDKLYFHQSTGKYTNTSRTLGESQGYHFVCTREQFEACVAAKKAKSEPEWTHIHGGGKKCRVLAVDGAESWVLDENGNKVTEFTNSLRPIKPTITEYKALDLMKTMCPYEWAAIERKYEVTND